MAKENTSGQKQTQVEPAQQYRVTPALDSDTTTTAKRKKGHKNHRPQVGGTAVSGAKSMQPRATGEASNPQQQQYDYSNRNMRRRMQQIGTAPDEENKAQAMRQKRQKRIERRKQELDTRRAALRRQMPTFGRRNLYFFLGTLAIIVILIVVFALLRANHILG